MKLNLNKKFINLDNSESTEYMSKAVAALLANQKHGDSMKFFCLAQSIFQTGEVEVDSADIILIKNTLNACEMTAMVKAQILKELYALEESPK